MATVNKDFKIKNGLVVEGSTATVNGNQVLTENASDQYIIDLIGGETLITSVNANDFAVVNGQLEINANSDIARTGDIPTSTDEISEGVNNKYYTDARVKNVLTNATQTNISITEIAGELHISAENGVADSTTDDLDEGTTNKYFTDGRAVTAVSNVLGTGIEYSGSAFDVQVGTGLIANGSNQIEVDRLTVDTWYDASGAASTVQGNLEDHASDTTTHGVTGNIVGTSDTQDLSNKRFIDTVYFTDGVTVANEGEIAVRSGNHDFDVQANSGDLNLKSTSGDVNITANVGSVVISADSNAYYGSVSAGNEIATHGYVDNAISGLDWKQSVNLLANINIPQLTDLLTETIDGHTVNMSSVGYRILLTNQDTDSENGIYEVVNGSLPMLVSLVRSADADNSGELVGAAVYVMEGDQYGSTSWVQGNHYLNGFEGQTWTQFSGTGSVTAGTGITVDGLEVSIDRTTVDTWYDAAGSAANALADANSYTDTGLSGKQDTLQAGTNIDISVVQGVPTVSVSGLDTDDVAEGTNQYFTTQRARGAVSAGTGLNYDSSTGEFSAKLGIVAPNGYNLVEADPVTGELIVLNPFVPLTTDDLAEGVNNHYFTDSRARTAAIDLLVNHSTKNNITIVEGPTLGNLVITAENGVADSTTDDLTEGTTNLYFTDARAQSAVDGTTRSFTAININDYRKEEATQQYVASTSTVTAHSFSYPYGSAKYLVRVVGSVGGVMHTQVTELLATIDGNNNVAVTEYGTIHTSESALATATVEYSGGTFNLRVTTLVGGAEVITAATMLSWAD